MADYAFVTTWRIEAPLDKVWDAICHADRWPSWWKGVERVVEVTPSDKNSIGSVRRYVWQSTLPYRLVFGPHRGDTGGN